MNPPIIVNIDDPDPNAAPLNLTELVRILRALASAQIVGSYTPYVISNTTPGVTDQDKAWIQLDSVTRPIATKLFYNGMWRRVYNGMPGETRGYTGDPTVDFDSNGLGLVGEAYDGWHLCNGLDGTPDFSDVFLIGGHMNNADGHSGYSSGWQTFVNAVTDQKTGGRRDNVLTADTTYRAANAGTSTNLRRWAADGNSPDDSGGLLGIPVSHGAVTGAIEIIPAPGDEGNPVPEPIENIPPFVATAVIIFVGYA